MGASAKKATGTETTEQDGRAITKDRMSAVRAVLSVTRRDAVTPPTSWQAVHAGILR